MKRIFSFISLAVLLTSCTAEIGTADFCKRSRLHASSPDASKVQILNGVISVWNKGDKVSVFYGTSINECWSFVGEDKAKSGDLEYVGDTRWFGTDSIIAVYPYSDSIRIDGKTLEGFSVPSRQSYEEGNFSNAFLAAMSPDTNLQFHYAHSFVKLNLNGFGNLKSVKLKARGGERLAGRATIDASGELPLLSINAADNTCDSIIIVKDDNSALVSLSGTGKCTFITIPSGTYSDGFELTATDDTGREYTSYYTGKLELNQGEYIPMDVNLIYETKIIVDFMNDPFTENLYTSSFTKDSTTVDPRNNHTYYTNGSPSYAFYMHAEYNEAGYGFYKNVSKGLIIGREDSYISFPKISNSVVSRIEYEAGSTSGSPYLAATLSGETPSSSFQVSSTGGSTVAGSSYEIIANSEYPEKNYHLVVGSANLCIRKLTIYYKKIK